MSRWIPLALLGACAPGTGVVEITAWGERQVVDGIETTDGWSVRFTDWVTAFRDVRLVDPKSGDPVASDSTVHVVQLAGAATPVALGEIEAPARRLQFGFDQLPPSAGAAVVGDVDPALRDAMEANGWSTWVAGSATRTGQSVGFAWGLDRATRSDACRDGRDDTDGIAVLADDITRAGLTVHVDHLLWSALGTEEAPLRFDAIADADADADGLVTADELRAVRTIDIGYETSGLAEDLYAMIAFSVATGTHVNGGGLCVVRAL